MEREFRRFLERGVLAHEFLRVHCDACGCEDRVLPEAPVRQWVLSLPFRLRYRMAYDAPLTSAVLRIFVRRVLASLRRRARRRLRLADPRLADPARAECGAVTFVQRFGGALNLVHFHTLVLDGVHVQDQGDGSGDVLRFRPLPPPDDHEVEWVARGVAR